MAPSANGKWAESVLFNVSGYYVDGEPVTSLALDSQANLYGGAAGGPQGTAILYQLTPGIGEWNFNILPEELVASGCESGDYNDCSYAILYKTGDLRILFAGDTHDASWDHILKNHKADVTDVDLLIAPHHGRDSDRDWSILDVLNPSLTLFGNARSEHLAYSAFSSRGFRIITNNQAGNIIGYIVGGVINIYVTHKPYADHSTANTFYADSFDAYYWGTVSPRNATKSA
jgi:hypothetical protein